MKKLITTERGCVALSLLFLLLAAPLLSRPEASGGAILLGWLLVSLAFVLPFVSRIFKYKN